METFHGLLGSDCINFEKDDFFKVGRLEKYGELVKIHEIDKVTINYTVSEKQT